MIEYHILPRSNMLCCYDVIHNNIIILRRAWWIPLTTGPVMFSCHGISSNNHIWSRQVPIHHVHLHFCLAGHVLSILIYKTLQIPTLQRFSYCLAAFFAKSLEAKCQVENEDVVGAAPAGDAPTTSEWSTMLLPTKVGLILEVSRYSLVGSPIAFRGLFSNTISIHCVILSLDKKSHAQYSVRCNYFSILKLQLFQFGNG